MICGKFAVDNRKSAGDLQHVPALVSCSIRRSRPCRLRPLPPVTVRRVGHAARTPSAPSSGVRQGERRQARCQAMPMRFEWHPEIEDAASAFGDPLSLTIFDPDHSDEEDRFILLGATNDGRLVVVVHVERAGVVRCLASLDPETYGPQEPPDTCRSEGRTYFGFPSRGCRRHWQRRRQRELRRPPRFRQPSPK
jgi:hypothetical protein